MSFNLLKSELTETIVLVGDAFKMGQHARNKGLNKKWNPFDDSVQKDFFNAWIFGWESINDSLLP